MEANDRLRFIDKYGNIIGKIQVNVQVGSRFLTGTLTVPVGNESNAFYAPFAPEIHDGKLYGRGPADMKGAVERLYSGWFRHFAKDCDRDCRRSCG